MWSNIYPHALTKELISIPYNVDDLKKRKDNTESYAVLQRVSLASWYFQYKSLIKSYYIKKKYF